MENIYYLLILLGGSALYTILLSLALSRVDNEKARVVGEVLGVLVYGIFLNIL